jgi:hypothetical protein
MFIVSTILHSCHRSYERINSEFDLLIFEFLLLVIELLAGRLDGVKMSRLITLFSLFFRVSYPQQVTESDTIAGWVIVFGVAHNCSGHWSSGYIHCCHNLRYVGWNRLMVDGFVIEMLMRLIRFCGERIDNLSHFR